MPIIPIKQNIMKTLEEITREEFNQMEKHHKQYMYTEAEAMEVVNLVRFYINSRQPSCMSCSNSLREAKTMLNEFYLANKDKMIQILTEREKVKEEEKAQDIIKNIKKTK
jgi:hypothetical protein